MRAFCSVLTLALSLLGAEAVAGMRCGPRVVSYGKTPLEVRALCGAPNHVDQTVELRVVRRRHPRLGVVEQRRTVDVERWTYVPAENRLIRTAVFENGRLVDVRTEGRPPSGDADLINCERSIHSRGDTIAEVLLRCGAPADVYRWYEEVTVANRNFETTRLIPHERWTYNFGPDRFLRFLTFENGRLVEQKTGDRGF